MNDLARSSQWNCYGVILKAGSLYLMPRVLHVLSQRPSLTGSGVTLDALVRFASQAGWDQHVVVGVPADDPHPLVGDLDEGALHALPFETSELPFPVPGMSDVMPYRSTRFSSMNEEQLDAYLTAWRRHLTQVIADTAPDVVHSHHVWLVSSIIKEVAPTTPVVTHCHATGLRQMELCPHLTEGVLRGCSQVDRFALLHGAHAKQLATTFGLPGDRLHIVGAGFREDLFHASGRSQAGPPRILFIGKLAAAKGLSSLLDAYDALVSSSGRDVELHVAGSGAGEEARVLAERMDSMAPGVVHHGHLKQPELADLMRRCDLCVLPSFFEGLPLVLVEALACGCRVVSTALPGVVEELAPTLGDALELVELPAMAGVDTPVTAELPAFASRLQAAMSRALAAEPLGDPMVTRPDSLAPFTWQAVFERVETIWKELGRAQEMSVKSSKFSKPAKLSENPYTKKILDFIDLHPECPRKTRRVAKAMSIDDLEYPIFRVAFRELRRTGQLARGKRASNRIVGTYKANQRGFGFVKPQKKDQGDVADVFIPLGSTGGALTGDVVVIERWATSPRRGSGPGEKRFQGEVIEVLERGVRQVVGTLEYIDGGWFLEPEGGQLMTPVIIDSVPSELTKAEKKDTSQQVTKVIVEITKYPDGPGMLPVGEVVEVLGPEGALETETMAMILSHELPNRFSEDALREAAHIVSTFDPVAEKAPKDRVDLTDRVIVTIDPEEARDFDDAVSLERSAEGTQELGVHIADVACFVSEGSALDLEAKERGTSVYFPRRVIPMLPQGVSNGVCALVPGEPRNAISVFITYDAKGIVVDRRVERSIISSCQRLSYEEAQQICDGPSETSTEEVTRLVRDLARLARIVRTRRTQAGMLSLDLPEVTLVLDDEGRVTDARPAPHLFTHSLIEMFMVEANEAVATLLSERGAPVLRRIHPSPTADSYGLLQRLARSFGQSLPDGPPSRHALQKLARSVRGQPIAHVINLQMLRSLQKATYSTEEEGHFALASSSYCHFTSPIRRYPDLIVHRMVIETLLAGSDRGKTEAGDREDSDDLEELAKHCSETERNAEAAEMELRQVLLLQHLAKKVGEKFTGVITSVTSFGPFVQSPQFLIEGLIPRDSLGGWWEVDTGRGEMIEETTGTTLRLGDRVEVTIARVDVAQRHLDLRLERPAERRRPKPKQKRFRRKRP